MSIERVASFTRRLAAVSLAASSASAQSRITLASATNSGAPPSFEGTGGPISAGGRFVLFETPASNVVAGDTNGKSDVFLRDLALSITERVSTYSNGAESPTGVAHNLYSTEFDVSGDGRFVVFATRDADFAAGAVAGVSNLFVKDRATGAVVLASRDSAGTGANDDCWSPVISDDARFVAFVSSATNLAPGDDGLFVDVFVHDLMAGSTECVSVDSSGVASNAHAYEPEISADGRFVAYESPASNLVLGDTNSGSGLNLDGYDVFVRDRLTATTERASVMTGGAQAQSGSTGASISADGRFVCFASRAPNLVPGDLNDRADVFVHDRLLGTTELASVGAGGVQAFERVNVGVISGDGNSVVFTTVASNLVPNDSNVERDVYVRDLARRTTTLVSQLLDGTSTDSGCYDPWVSHDGRFVTFQTRAAFTSAGSLGTDVFVADRGPFAPLAYCTAKVNSLGCVPAIGATGVASASSASGCFVHVVNWREAKPLQLAYGVSGPNAAPFHGGTLCVRSPLRRLALRLSSGGSATGCTGATSDDFNATIAAGLDPALAAGQHVWCQYFGRDEAGLPGFAYSTSDAVELAIEP